MLCQFQVAQHLFNLTGASPQCAPNSGKYIGGSIDIEKGAKLALEILLLERVKNKIEKQDPLREPDLMLVITG